MPNADIARSSASRSCCAVVLAAGEGTRMKSGQPKVLHRIAGRSMIGHAVEAVRKAGASHIAVVIGPGRADVSEEARRILPEIEVFTQAERLGTAHAVLAARAALERGADDIVIAFADTPLVEPATLSRLRQPLAEGAAIAVLGFEARDPKGYGRLIVGNGRLAAIREEKDASEAERTITLCNAGLMALRGNIALRLLDRIENRNAQGEFYLTDIVEVAQGLGETVASIVAPEDEVQGVNDRIQLANAEAVIQVRLRKAAMANGATLVAPETVFFSFDTQIGRDVLVEPYVYFGPGVVVEEGAVIHAFSHLEGARVARHASLGPYARLRPGASLGEKARVGNFVEIKNADLGAGAKVNHLSYIGDASVGANANIGAGTITCNYDGFSKHRTAIGEGAFVGTNASLVAPVTVGDGAYIGSGSVITDDVPPDALALGRGRQAIKEGWAAGFRQKAKAKKEN
jgi:bifunctional UDP-N-acetylglucosamine pyrophosphorylase / glucosamine-1-phosphate N-acetyltransferase